MTLDKIIASLISLSGIAFTYWYFLGKKEDTVIEAKNNQVNIVVDGGYSPETISVVNNKTTILKFLRKDPSSCLEEVVLTDFRIKKFLPLNQIVEIPITPQKKGEFNYSCGMNMFHGKIIVK